MPARKHEVPKEKYTARQDVEPLNEGANLSDLMLAVLAATNTVRSRNAVVQKHGIEWRAYTPKIENGVGYLVRETCERCGKVALPPGQRRLTKMNTAIGPIYLDAGICHDCINASVFVDKYLDGDPLSEADAKKLFYKYAEEYEKQWRVTLAIANNITMTRDEWLHRCDFFNGCAFCGGYIDVQHKYFPSSLNGTYTPWNILPACADCSKQQQQIGKRKSADVLPHRYKVFSSPSSFQRTKTIRLFLLAQMEAHSIYIENLRPYRERFLETKILPHSLPIADLDADMLEPLIILCRTTSLNVIAESAIAKQMLTYGIPEENVLAAITGEASWNELKLLFTSMRLQKGTDNDT